MGYVFTPKDKEKGRIPAVKGYEQAIQRLKSELDNLATKGIIYGAMLNGSNFSTDGGIGSDVDVLVITQTSSALDNLNGLCVDVFDGLHVPLEFIPISKENAIAANHTLNLFYFDYLREFCSGGFIGSNPLGVIAPLESWSSPKREVIAGITKNIASFSKARAAIKRDFGEAHCDFLEKIIRQPVYSAIDVLRLGHSTLPSHDGWPLSKRGCCEVYYELFGTKTKEDLDGLLDLRGEYKTSLANSSLDEYCSTLERIDSSYDSALRILETNLSIAKNFSK